MKQVTIENVQARIAQLETSEQIGGRLPIRHEFEMACLRMLVELMQPATECAHIFEARPIDGSNSANVPCQAVCKFCGAIPSPVTDNTAQQFEALATSNDEDKLEARRSRNRLANARARAKETPEQANKRRAANRARMQAARSGKL